MNKAVFLIFLVWSSSAFSSDATTVRYSGVERDVYTVKMLKHALSYAQNKSYSVEAFGQDLPKFREFEIMDNNDGIDVITGGATLERVEKYQAVRFPLLKGLHGWRIPLVNRKNQALFKYVSSLAEFKQKVAGQFHTWSDTAILESNGITVEKGTDVEGLYGMLDRARFDYFPRSVLEVKWDYESHQDLNIAIDQYILIHYPAAYYFYVRKGNHELASDLLHGLESAYEDGSFDALFMAEYGEVIREATEVKRKVFHLNNPHLPAGTPTERKELWIDLGHISSITP